MGYIEETGAAQILRDARITTIYEGTTAIQANDLIGRKIARDGGAAVRNLVAEISALVAELVASDDETLRNIAHELSNGADAIEQACTYIVTHWASDIRVAHAAAVPLLRLFGTVCGGWQMARAALIAQQRLASGADNTAFLRKKVSTAHFYAAQVLPQSKSWLAAVLSAHTCLAVDAWPTN